MLGAGGPIPDAPRDPFHLEQRRRADGCVIRSPTEDRNRREALTLDISRATGWHSRLGSITIEDRQYRAIIFASAAIERLRAPMEQSPCGSFVRI